MQRAVPHQRRVMTIAGEGSTMQSSLFQGTSNVETIISHIEDSHEWCSPLNRRFWSLRRK